MQTKENKNALRTQYNRINWVGNTAVFERKRLKDWSETEKRIKMEE